VSPPNQVTMLRLVLSPVFILCFFLGEIAPSMGLAGRIAALVVAVLFEVTDLLDGYLARRMGCVTDLGKYLDPLADSLSRFSVFLCFLVADFAAIWMVAVLFYRDSIVSTVRIAAATQNRSVAARASGKIKAIVQGAVILLLLCWDIAGNAGVAEAARSFGSVAFWSMTVVTVVTALSGIDYIAGHWTVIRSMKA
jgi:CDP-diacylglycerol--glycerol-3-phosphate 3-phosphatidyltransferase